MNLPYDHAWNTVVMAGLVPLVAAGLSVNILCTSDKSRVQRGFLSNSAGDLLLALRFLGKLYNFCNVVIIFSLM